MQAQFRLLPADIFTFMNSTVSKLADKIHLGQKLIIVNQITEITVLEQGIQRCLIGHRERFINGVYPFYGDFHCLTTTDNR